MAVQRNPSTSTGLAPADGPAGDELGTGEPVAAGDPLGLVKCGELATDGLTVADGGKVAPCDDAGGGPDGKRDSIGPDVHATTMATAAAKHAIDRRPAPMESPLSSCRAQLRRAAYSCVTDVHSRAQLSGLSRAESNQPADRGSHGW